jgi:hypothetical protein
VSWDEKGECFGYPPELFQATQRGRAAPGVRESLCEPCPVATVCLIDGWWDEYSVRGGMTPIARRAVSRYLDARLAERPALPEAAETG